MSDLLYFDLATLLVLGACFWSFQGRSAERRPIWNHALLVVALLAQTGFLLKRGEILGRCPITNAFEATAFLSWSLLLTHFVIGSAYRLSILGAFTAPLMLVLNGSAFLLANDDHPEIMDRLPWSVELHATLSILSYGTLGLAAVAGAMYLIQEHHLKQHDLTGWFYRLPSMGDLETVQHRVLCWGFLLLTVGFISGIPTFSSSQVSLIKVIWAIAVWLWYFLVLVVPRFLHLSHRKRAWASTLGYLLVMVSFWGITRGGGCCE